MMITPSVCVLDACVLYPANLRDLFMWLAQKELYSPRWTEQIHQEWIRNVLADHPEYTEARLLRTRALMERAAPDALVTGHEPLIPTLALPVPDDCHVLAAAIHAQADFIVTLNLRHFPRVTLAAHNVKPLHPDLFVLDLLKASPLETVEAIREQRAALQSSPRTPAEHLERLHNCGLKQTVAHLKAMNAVL